MNVAEGYLIFADDLPQLYNISLEGTLPSLSVQKFMYRRPSPMVYFPALILIRDLNWLEVGIPGGGAWLYLWRDIDVHGLDADILRVRHFASVGPTVGLMSIKTEWKLVSWLDPS